ncbi:alkaline phosphatase D family protein [Corynebacterium uterequi]|nr:alkaline phosphatase D family protein [Corynebacterium uterequi]
MTHNRRRFLQSAAVTTAAAAAVSPGVAQAQSSLSSEPVEPVANPVGELPFLHGVASGDPLPDTVVLWTRVTPSPDAMPGSGVGEDVTLRWEVAADETFSSIIAGGEVVATAATDHTVHVDPWNLQPSTVYYYRFTVLSGTYAGTVSPVGRTQTAPSLDASPENLRFAVASCANWESGFFRAYADMAQRGYNGELDFTLFLGDYIYEYAQGEYSGFGPYRWYEPAHEIISLADYRIRYALHRTDPNLQAAHAAMPWIVVWDDHETANNSWLQGAENHNPATEGEWLPRRNAAFQAYFEWLPVRATNPSEGGHIYRSFSFGDLAELLVMDLRTYRDEGVTVKLWEAGDPDRTMLGTEQSQWLMGKISTHDAAWTILGNSVMYSEMNLATLHQDPQMAELSSFLTEHRIDGIPVNGDQWDGYAYERAKLKQALADTGKKVLVCTGDIHSEWGHVVVTDDGREIGAEVVCTSITAPGGPETIGLPPETPLFDLAHAYIQSANPDVRHVSFRYHGYCVAKVDRSGVSMEYWRVNHVGAQDSGMNLGHSWRWDG